MCKKLVATIILWCCFYSALASDELCSEIMKRKDYYNAMERGIAEITSSRAINFLPYCKAGIKFSVDLFKDPEALLCANLIFKYLETHRNEFNPIHSKCHLQQNGLKDLECVPLDKFERCIYDNMYMTLKGIAYQENPKKEACRKCSESAFFKNCTNRFAYVKCQRFYKALKPATIGEASCKICDNSKKSNKGNKECKGFGKNCEKKCHCKHDDPCDVVSGKCPNGCGHGYYGENCQKNCKEGFGKECELKCHCKDNARCDVVSGTCPNGCDHGYYGENCQNTCIPGYYSYNCIARCHCKKQTPCDASTGVCEKGCAPEWKGDVCDVRVGSSTKVKGATWAIIIAVICLVCLALVIGFILFKRSQRENDLQIHIIDGNTFSKLDCRSIQSFAMPKEDVEKQEKLSTSMSHVSNTLSEKSGESSQSKSKRRKKKKRDKESKNKNDEEEKLEKTAEQLSAPVSQISISLNINDAAKNTAKRRKQKKKGKKLDGENEDEPVLPSTPSNQPTDNNDDVAKSEKE